MLSLSDSSYVAACGYLLNDLCWCSPAMCTNVRTYITLDFGTQKLCKPYAVCNGYLGMQLVLLTLLRNSIICAYEFIINGLT